MDDIKVRTVVILQLVSVVDPREHIGKDGEVDLQRHRSARSVQDIVERLAIQVLHRDEVLTPSPDADDELILAKRERPHPPNLRKEPLTVYLQPDDRGPAFHLRRPVLGGA